MKPERGQRLLLRAFARALREVPDAWLVLVGRGEDEPALRALAAELSASSGAAAGSGAAASSGRIVFAGYQRGPLALREAYRALDVAVWLREGNDGACRGVLEAMACGVPVIAGDEGAPGELAAGAGRVVRGGDEAAVAGVLRELLGDLALARRLGLAAREAALGLTPALAAARTLAFWRQLRDLPPA